MCRPQASRVCVPASASDRRSNDDGKSVHVGGVEDLLLSYRRVVPRAGLVGVTVAVAAAAMLVLMGVRRSAVVEGAATSIV